MPLVSVVIDNYNYAEFVRDALDSARAQTYPRTEVVAVDDGSTDGSDSVIAGAAGVRPVLKDHGGQGSALNAGFAACAGEVVIFLDADDVLAPTAAARAVSALAPDVVNVRWPMVVVDRSGTELGVMPDIELPEGDLGHLSAAGGPLSFANAPLSANAWRRSMLERILPLPGSRYVTGADSYLHALAPGWGRLQTLPEPLGRWRRHERNDSRQPLDIALTERIARWRHDCDALAAQLARQGAAVDRSGWDANPHVRWLRRILAAARVLAAASQPGQTIAILGAESWPEGELVSGRVSRRLALPGAGHEAGLADQLAGADLLAVGWPAFGWLSRHPGAASALRARYRPQAATDDILVFAVRSITTSQR
ncbi:MAG: glycosyltransferase family 2 protein [Acidimicrobiales bacterium]